MSIILFPLKEVEATVCTHVLPSYLQMSVQRHRRRRRRRPCVALNALYSFPPSKTFSNGNFSYIHKEAEYEEPDNNNNGK